MPFAENSKYFLSEKKVHVRFNIETDSLGALSFLFFFTVTTNRKQTRWCSYRKVRHIRVPCKSRTSEAHDVLLYHK